MPEPIIEIKHVAIESLKPDGLNPRRIGDAELEALTRSIAEFGLVDPIIAREEDGMVIGGHQRLVAARRAGMKTVPVVYLAGLSEERSRLLNLALNHTGGRFDDELLARLLKDLSSVPSLDLTVAGFDQAEVTKLIRKLDAREKRGRPETLDFLREWEAAQAADVSPGDLYALGEHRLLCGSATSLESCARLLDGGTARMAFTDPPYNVNYGQHGGAGRGTRRRAIDARYCALAIARWEAFTGAKAKKVAVDGD